MCLTVDLFAFAGLIESVLSAKLTLPSSRRLTMTSVSPRMPCTWRGGWSSE